MARWRRFIYWMAHATRREFNDFLIRVVVYLTAIGMCIKCLIYTLSKS